MSDGHTLSGRRRGRARYTRRALLRLAGGAGAALLAYRGAGNARAATGSMAVFTAPVKERSTYYTPEKVAAARRNIATYGWAATIRDGAVALASPYLALTDEQLWGLVTPQRLPRGYAVNQALGSPVTGRAIYTFGNYPWRAAPLTRPWKLEDPSSGYLFPTNDFGAYYRSGIDERGLFDPARADRGLLVNTLYPEKGPAWGVDDGFGWVDPRGQKWTFIAYYNHWWLWYAGGAIATGIRACRDAFIYTGDLRYAHAGLILLDRAADLYPAMDLAPYPVSAGFLNSHGGTGKGKVVGSIWETGLARDLVAAYDAFFPAVAAGDDAGVLPFLSAQAARYGLANPKRTPADLRRNIEEGILRQIFPAVQSARIRGNFGMHQSTLALAAVTLDDPGASREWLDWVFQTGGLVRDPDWRLTGGDVLATLVDDVDRDGFGNEAAPGYNTLWVGQLRGVADILRGYDRYPAADLYTNVKFKRLFDGWPALVLAGAYTPTIGDSGKAGNPGVVGNPLDYVKAFEEYGDPLYAQFAHFRNGGTMDRLYSGIFSADPGGTMAKIQATIEEHGPLAPGSANLTGYGFAALRDGAAAVARDLWVYYGRNTGHGHKDALNLGMHAFGIDLLPDLGYPEFADQNAKRFEWNANTIAHNTVVVDATPQAPHWVGTPRDFAVGTGAQVVDIAAPRVYPQTSLYRRTTALMKVDDTNSYAVDFFRVKGGSEHHYSFHAAAGPAIAEGLNLVAQPTGTYAGPDVAMPDLRARPRPGASGFDWLDQVARDLQPAGQFSVDWAIRDTWNVRDPDPDLHLRLTMLGALDDVALANGYPPSNKPGNPQSLRYLVAHRAGENLESQFVAVIEPYEGARYIAAIAPATLELDGEAVAGPDAAALRVTLVNGRVDYIVSALRPDVQYRVDRKFAFKGRFGVYSELAGEPVYALLSAGTLLGSPDKPLVRAVRGAVTGKVADFTRDLRLENRLVVRVGGPPVDPRELMGRHIYVENDGVRNAAYRIEAATYSGGDTYVLDIGGATPVRRHSDAADFAAGYVYDVAPGAVFSIPLAREWRP